MRSAIAKRAAFSSDVATPPAPSLDLGIRSATGTGTDVSIDGPEPPPEENQVSFDLHLKGVGNKDENGNWYLTIES
mgnify:CR=1 FL=1